jgi:hypothetical protein
MFVFLAFNQLLRSLLVPRLVLLMENFTLRQQLLVHRSTNRPRLSSHSHPALAGWPGKPDRPGEPF